MTNSTERSLARQAGSVLGLLAICVAFPSCGVSDEQQIHERIDQGVDAARAGDLIALREFVSPDYTDERGLDRQGLLGMVALTLRGGDSLHFLSRTRGVRLTGPGRAEAEVLLAVADLPIDDLESLKLVSADLLWIELVFVDEGDWKVESADWREAALQDFLTP
jgi:hypothetical protein